MRSHWGYERVRQRRWSTQPAAWGKQNTKVNELKKRCEKNKKLKKGTEMFSIETCIGKLSSSPVFSHPPNSCHSYWGAVTSSAVDVSDVWEVSLKGRCRIQSTSYLCLKTCAFFNMYFPPVVRWPWMCFIRLPRRYTYVHNWKAAKTNFLPSNQIQIEWRSYLHELKSAALHENIPSLISDMSSSGKQVEPLGIIWTSCFFNLAHNHHSKR